MKSGGSPIKKWRKPNEKWGNSNQKWGKHNEKWKFTDLETKWNIMKQDRIKLNKWNEIYQYRTKPILQSNSSVKYHNYGN
jgi:hypothetical protein